MLSSSAISISAVVTVLLSLPVVRSINILRAQCPNFELSISSNLACSTSGDFERISKVNSSSFGRKNIFRSRTSSHFLPWTHQPVCTDAVKGITAPLCVFTNASFATGRGMSIITTAEIASEFLSLPPLSSAATSSGVNIEPSNQPWQAESIPNKGIGLVATESIASGSLVAAYQPVVVVHPAISRVTEPEGLIRLAVDQLPSKTASDFLNLSTHLNKPGLICQDILKSNSFELSIGSAQTMHMAIVPETSRLNHDCGPNGQYFWDPLHITQYIHTSRDIAPGEEITVSYIDPFASHAVRQQHLSSFGFSCTCRKCTNAAASDRRLGQINELQRVLNDWNTRDATPQKAVELIKLSEVEGLEAFLDVAYGHAALSFSSVGDEKNTKKYAEMAREKSWQRYGPSSPDMDMWDELVQKPMSHWSWMWRKKKVH